jgi:hypothetical protein
MPRAAAAHPLTATIPRTGAVLADRVLVATGAASMRGLLGRDCLAPGDGLSLIPHPKSNTVRLGHARRRPGRWHG